MPACNVHMHLFTMDNAPEKFLHLYLPAPVANVVDNVTNTSLGSWAVRQLLRLAGEGGKRYASFLAIGKSRNQAEVFETLLTAYPDQNMKFVALTLHMEACGAGQSKTGFVGQLEEVLKVRDRYPERLLVFMGLDPRWKNSGIQLRDEVVRLFETKRKIGNGKEIYPFAGLKLYPSTGFYPFDERLKETFKWAAENEVPILSHCNYMGGIYNNDSKYLRAALNPFDPYAKQIYNSPKYIEEKNFGKWLLGRKKSFDNQKTCSYFLEPESYRSMLTYFQKTGAPLKLCLAHFGGSDEMLRTWQKGPSYSSRKEPYGTIRKNWFTQIQDLMKNFPGVYTDISYTLSEEKVWDKIFDELNDPIYGDRILFGTDFFLTEREQPEFQTYSSFKEEAVKRIVNGPAKNAWDKISENNANAFLMSKYYP